MPKVVDPEARRDEVVDAVFRVVRRAGFEQASLRNVAEEAGLAIGSVRHYFDGHTDLMVFAMRASLDRVSARLTERVGPLLATQDEDERAEGVELMLSELLPLDERRRDEATVWLAFATAARTRPELRPLARESYDGMRTLVRRIVDGIARRRRLAGDPKVETERLCALIDGLTVEGVLHPERMTPELMVQALRRHLQTLVEPRL
ncbi:TetR/AcrR family transcriptional regulator [Nonomuraea turcica]|uniref:TetR/AcrR family transcriptional regulator n=1 Tax=Nonomuraea sp. G32 TaxID=3067274 RepID=UPI00273BB8B0|nr:TetR family transcriptional regulator C-terminal domain-containing protein [Nonomuraea sp. G32]MDP4508874.1 TetR family transcriptional regulator C-terminal domain-containing protein [Nonomuraea sp. G32]